MEKIATQLGILIFGCTAVWLIGRPESWRRWGYVFGLCSQPFWFYLSYNHADWGVFILTCLYSYSWAQGVWFHWYKPERVQPEDKTLVPEAATQEPARVATFAPHENQFQVPERVASFRNRASNASGSSSRI
jgi:nicotinamide riboside transporter PnuC